MCGPPIPKLEPIHLSERENRKEEREKLMHEPIHLRERENRKEEREKLIHDSLIKPKRNPMLYVMK